MIRLTWLQFRLQSVVAVAALALVALVLGLTGPHLAHLYNTTVANCTSQGDCPAAGEALLRTDAALQNSLGRLLLVVPALLGIFWGAPLIARELESGTFRLVWTQSVTRGRWLAVKLGALGLASVAVAGLLSLMVTWWFRPIDKVTLDRFTPGAFDERGIVALGYAAFAFALGVTAGVVIRRTLPAMAVTLVVFVATRLAIADWVRPHLAAPVHTSIPLTSAAGLGFVGSPAGVTFVADAPHTIPNAWYLATHIVDKAGRAATQAILHQFLQQECPAMVAPHSPPAGLTKTLNSPGPANQAAFQNCVAKLATKFHVVATYQPASHYWTFQWYEMGIFLALALILAACCFWWVRYRLV